MQAPGFWTDPRGRWHPLSLLLWPVSQGWRFATARRVAKRGYRAQIPVICVGNITVGGVGKTPFALMLADILKQLGHEPAFLTRGYGGQASGPLLVTPDHSFEDVGDEALLLATCAQTCVASDRGAGARLIERTTEATVIVMDDGFQNPTLEKTMSFILVDAEAGFGNGRIVPAGPLREPLQAGLSRADAMAIITQPGKDVPTSLTSLANPPPVLSASIIAEDRPESDGPFVAFAGIGRPEKFFATLDRLGLTLSDARCFPDHHPYGASDLESLRAHAKAHDARLITTQKDYVRLPASFRPEVSFLPIRMQPLDNDQLKNLLLEGLNG